MSFARLVSALAGLPIVCVVAACGPGALRPAGAEPARVVRPTIGLGPKAPDRGLPIPDLAVRWAPPRVVAGSVDVLGEVLSANDVLAVRLGSSFAGEVWAQRTSKVLAQLRPGRASELLATRGTAGFLADPLVPLRRNAEGDLSAGPTYASELPLAANWQATLGVEGRDGAVLVLDDPALDAAAWAALPARAVGSCDPALDALAAGQEQSLAYLETFLDHADDVLWAYFRSELAAVLPEMLAAREAFAQQAAAPGADPEATASGADPETVSRHACGHADWLRLREYQACLDADKPCSVAPRIFLIGGARVGTVEPTAFVDPSCATASGRDFPEELRQLSREAAGQAVEHLDVSWVALSDRLGTVTEVHDALEDICTPRRRRFAAADLEVARDRLAEIGRALGAPPEAEPGARWMFGDASFFVPGLGAVTEVARFEAGRGSVAQDIRSGARGLRQFVLSRSLCRSGYRPTPLFAAVVDVDAATPRFAGYFYEEELFCADLPPATGDTSAGVEAAATSVPLDPPDVDAAAPPP